MNTNVHIKKVIDAQTENQNIHRDQCIDKYGQKVLETLLVPDGNGSSCPAFWDTITCWPRTPAGQIAELPCARWMGGFLPERNATRKCLQNGMWYMDQPNHTWSNYSRCYDTNTTRIVINCTDCSNYNVSEIFKVYIPVAKHIATTGYTVSLFTLIAALAIMLSIKKLHCARNILHMHLFASFLLRAFTYLLSNMLMVDGIGLASDFNGGIFYIDSETNNWACKFINTLLKYFLTANYFWILMEGLYLHNLIFRAMFVDSCNNIKWYIIIGWGLPLVIIHLWVVARIFFDDKFCWNINENVKVFMVIEMPIIVSTLVNFVLFVRISMVLFRKLKSPITEDNQMRYRKWVKSTLVLVPLFGVHYAICQVLFFSSPNDIVRVCWILTDTFFGSFQGAIVGVLYCFLNGEVKSELAPHFCQTFTFLATNKYSKYLFPYRKEFLKTVVGRSSVSTTMSCSSLYNNGVLHRNSKGRVDTKRPEHSCHTNGVKHMKNLGNHNNDVPLAIECQTMKICCDDETHHKMIVENNF